MEQATTLAQFKAKSLNNTLELCYVIDNWVTMLHKNEPLIVDLCAQAKQALMKTLIAMRRDIRQRQFIDLTSKEDQSYYISMNHHEIVLGVETFLDPFDPNTIDDNKEYFKVFARFGFPILSVNDWAKVNDVQPNTVRQWINRERINYIKKENGIGISLMQYNPNAISQDIPRSALYQNIGQVPDNVAGEFPFLREKDIIALHILPQDTNMHRVVIFAKTNEQNCKTTTRSYDVVLTRDERDKLMKALENSGYINKREHNYIAPLPEAEWTLSHRLPVISDINGAKQSLKDYPPIGYVGKLDASDFHPVWETGMKIQNTTLLSIKGILLRMNSPEDALMAAIFAPNDDTPNAAVKAVKEDSGWQIDNGWAEDTLYVNHLSIMQGCKAADAVLFLKTLSYRIFNICRHRFCRILFQLPDITPETASILTDAGYRHIPDTQVFYAYVL